MLSFVRCSPAAIRVLPIACAAFCKEVQSSSIAKYCEFGTSSSVQPAAFSSFHGPRSLGVLHTRLYSAQSNGQPSTASTYYEYDDKLGSFKQAPKHGDQNVQMHPSLVRSEKGESYMMMHPVYQTDYVEGIQPKHLAPATMLDKAAFMTINSVRWVFDKVTGYKADMPEAKWLQRILFLETVAGVPGMVGGMLRHLKSLRSMKRDHGWIHTLLEEAENERMHLLTFMQIRQPGPIFRGMVILAQGVFFNAYFLAYLISPKFCHRMVGYLEEEAVKTYTHCLHDLDAGRLPAWKDKPAPELARFYWKLPEDATMRDLILAVRADEACHSHVNHTFANLGSTASNPFGKGSVMVP